MVGNRKVVYMSYYRCDSIDQTEARKVRNIKGRFNTAYFVYIHDSDIETEGRGLEKIPEIVSGFSFVGGRVKSLSGVAEEVVNIFSHNELSQVKLYATRNRKFPFGMSPPVVTVDRVGVNVEGNYDEDSDVLRVAYKIAEGIEKLKSER